MKIGRTLPPAAAPLSWKDIASGLGGIIGRHTTENDANTQLATIFGKKYCLTVSSGKAALLVILTALKKLHPGRDKVLIPAYACYSVPSAITRAGLRIELCDIDLATLDFDAQALSTKLKDPGLLCVIALHLFGLPADVERLRRMRCDPEVTIIEDAAQAMGGEWQGKQLGTLGDVGFFSLGRGKALTAIEGGVVLTDNDALGEELEASIAGQPACGAGVVAKQVVYAVALLWLLNPNLFWLPNALPFLHLGETVYDPDFPLRRFSAFQAGLLGDVSDKLQKIRSIRGENIQFWAEHCPYLLPCLRQCSPLPDLIRFPLLLPDPQAVGWLMDQSRVQGLGVAQTYPDALHGIRQLAANFIGQEFPQARQAAQHLVTLPVHGFLREQDRLRILGLLTAVKDRWGTP